MKAPENSLILDSSRFLSSLLDEIPRIHTFKGKWSLIKSKLTDLQTQLTDFSDFTSSSSNSLSLELLRSVSITLSDAFSLSQKCQNANLSDGKLKTQSDIDSILAKLDRHGKDCDILIRSGVLQDVGVLSCGSKKEAVRVESRNLITRLQIGNTESKTSAMESLLRLLHEDDKNVMIAVAQGVVPVLIRLLDSSSLAMKEMTVAAISRVSMVDSSKHVLAAEGLLLLNHLLRVLESGSGFAKEKACVALQSLSFSKENTRAIGSRGGIASLLEICQAGTVSSQALAAGVLRNLAEFSDVKVNFIEENAIVVILGLSASGTALAKENAIGCLSNLISDDETLKLCVVKEGGLECLKNFWDSGPSIRGLEVAVEFLRRMATRPSLIETLVSDGFISRIAAVFNSGVLSLRIVAAQAVYELGYSTKTRKEIGECGCIVSLIKMLDGKAAEEREAAMKALSSLMMYAGNRRILRKDDRGIVSVVNLLDPSILNLDKKYPVSILAMFVHSKNCRKQMIAAGAGAHLLKLVEMDVDGAKKLLESLSRVKIWGVFARP